MDMVFVISDSDDSYLLLSNRIRKVKAVDQVHNYDENQI